MGMGMGMVGRELVGGEGEGGGRSEERGGGARSEEEE